MSRTSDLMPGMSRKLNEMYYILIYFLKESKFCREALQILLTFFRTQCMLSFVARFYGHIKAFREHAKNIRTHALLNGIVNSNKIA